jgi:CxxC motif-containing protein
MILLLKNAYFYIVRIAVQLIFLFLSNVLVAQLFDNFSDNNLTNNVAWKGDVSSFTIDGAQRMRLNSAIAGSSFIYTDYAYKDSFVCSASVKLEFNPSGSNYARLYFLIDNIDFTLANGYFIQLGENGAEDAVRFYKVAAGQNTLIGSGQLGTINKDSSDLKISIKSNGSGSFTVQTDHNLDGGFEDVFVSNDVSFKPSIGRYFGIQCLYTSTRRDKFAFDDISIESINNDTTSPLISAIEVKDQKTINIRFNEGVEKSFAEDKSNYIFSPGVSIDKVTLTSPNQVTLSLIDLIADKEYVLEVKNIKDLNNNIIKQNANKIIFISPVMKGDIVISEILFDPFTGSKDFIELYNTTDKSLQLANLQITNSGNKQSRTLSSYVIRPKSYVAISEDTSSVKDQYSPPDSAKFIQNSIPALNIDAGNVTISFNGVVLDSFNYSEDIHHSLIDKSDVKGISLEKVVLEPFNNSTSNWHSAAKSVNYGTPGYKNSNFFQPSTIDASKFFNITDKVFTPNSDGDKDLLIIQYELDEPGYVANAKIFSGDGYLVKDLAKNELLGTNGILKWDGSNNDGYGEKMGIYVIVGDLFSTSGSTKKFKLSCVLALP